MFELTKDVEDTFEIEGGQRPNMVPDKCRFEGSFDVQKAKEIISIKGLNDKAEVF